MSASAIGAFLNGAIEGRERRRRWDQENEDREWTRSRRGRQVVLDGQTDEDRDRRIEEEDYTRGRTRAEHGREDEVRRVTADGYARAEQAAAEEEAIRGSVAPLVPDYEPLALARAAQAPRGRFLQQPEGPAPVLGAGLPGATPAGTPPPRAGGCSRRRSARSQRRPRRAHRNQPPPRPA